jgi:hypothetical protein
MYERKLEEAKAAGGNAYASDYLHDISEDLFNSCSPYCVDVEKMRLRVHGMKVDKVQSLLTSLSDIEALSVTNSWSSSLVQHLKSYMSGAGLELPLQIVRAMADTWPADKYSYEDSMNTFAHLFEIGLAPGAAYLSINNGREKLLELAEPLYGTNRAVGVALYKVLESIGTRMWAFILANRGCFGRLSRCDIRAGDER